MATSFVTSPNNLSQHVQATGTQLDELADELLAYYQIKPTLSENNTVIIPFERKTIETRIHILVIGFLRSQENNFTARDLGKLFVWAIEKGFDTDLAYLNIIILQHCTGLIPQRSLETL